MIIENEGRNTDPVMLLVISSLVDTPFVVRLGSTLTVPLSLLCASNLTFLLVGGTEHAVGTGGESPALPARGFLFILVGLDSALFDGKLTRHALLRGWVVVEVLTIVFG